MRIDIDDPRLTAYALGEPTDPDVAASVDGDPRLEAEVTALRGIADRLRRALASEPAVGLTPSQREAVLAPGGSEDEPRRALWRRISARVAPLRAGGGSSAAGPDAPRPPVDAAGRMRVALALAGAGAAIILLAIGARTVATRGRQLAGSIALGTPTAGHSDAATQSVASSAGGGRGLLSAEPTPGVYFRLADAEPARDAESEGLRNVTGVALSPATVDRYLARLPDLPASVAVTTTFALRSGPRPPAIPGETKMQVWPPPATAAPPPEVPTQPLTVVRAGPEGDVPMATQLTVTFSEPMVPLTSHGALSQAEVPVKLSPQPEGQWRWVGTKTLLFEPKPRFPQATEYAVVVPAGTKSARGAALASDYRLVFRTPPPSVEDFHPRPPLDEYGPWTDRQPVIFFRFDQRVDAAAVLEHLQATSGGASVALRQATIPEIEADDVVKQMVRDTIEGRWVAYRPAAPLPVGASVELVLDAGLPSAEGPRPMGVDGTYGFHVHNPLRIVGPACTRPEAYVEGDGVPGGDSQAPYAYPGPAVSGLSIDHCEPGRDWSISLNNELDPAAFDPGAFRLTPGIEDASFAPSGHDVTIVARSEGRSTYVVAVPAGLKDIYGQVLAEPVDVTFSTGAASPALYAPGEDMIVLDPAAGGKLTLAEINNDVLKVALYRVEPSNWGSFVEYARAMREYANGWNQAQRPTAQWQPIWQSEVPTGGERDRLTPVNIDLAPALVGGLGQVVVVAEPDEWMPHDPYDENRPAVRWVQATRLGLAYTGDGESAAAWVTDLTDGSPVPGAGVAWSEGGGSATTGSDGLAMVSEPPSDCSVYYSPCMLVAELGSDSAFVLADAHPSHAPDGLLWYVFDDRGIYQPGEDARVKGWVRPVTWGASGDLQPPSTEGRTVDYTFTAPNGEEIASGSIDTTAAGGFDLTLHLPEEMELGDAYLRLSVGGDGESHVINVAEFRRPEFEVKATAAEPYAVLGDTAIAEVMATYYSGGPLAGAEARWSVSAYATHFAPPGHDDFTFGRFVPWWEWNYAYGRDYGYSPYGTDQSSKEHTGYTDADGRHRLAIAVDNVVPLAPASFTAEATVQDVNRQAWTSSATFLVHPARYYVGLRADRWFAEPGESFSVEAIVSDLDGQLVAGTPMAIVAERHDWVFKGGKYVEDSVRVGGCDLGSAAEPVACRLTFDRGGTYVVTATVADPEGRENITEIELHVSGDEPMPLGAGADASRIEIIPDKPEYSPGDVAHLLVRSPFVPAEGLMSVARDGMVSAERFRMDGATATLDVPIGESSMPNIGVEVTVAGTAIRTGADAEPDPSLPPAPAFASASVALAVPPRSRTLAVEAVPREPALAPAATTSIDVTVRDAAGKPVPGAEVALVVADEAVLALTAYDIGDPVEAFHPGRNASLDAGGVQDFLWLADPALLATGAVGIAAAIPNEGGMGGGGDGGAALMALEVGDADLLQRLVPAAPAPTREPPAPKTGGPDLPYQDQPVFERTNMSPLALFAPRLVTDDAGRVSADLKLPDSVTRYRITAVASDGAKSFGKGESSITARLPLAVRPSAPRFLNFGDTFELPIVVQNQTGAPLETDVVVRAANLRLGEGTPLGARVTVPANDRVEVRFPAAAEMPGDTVVQAAAFAGALADAQRVSLPVWTPATTEAFATYGEVDEGAIAQPVVRPPDAVPQFGGLEMTLTSTALENLTDAYLFLKDYPFESSEAVASRLLATTALKDVLAAFQVPGVPDAATIDAAVRRDLGKLAALQNYDGGFGWWSRSYDYGPRSGSAPFLTVHVTHALARAIEKGYAPQDNMVSQARSYLENIESHLDEWDITGEARNAITAYALYTRMLLGERDAAKAREVFARPGERDVDTLGWLLFVLSADEASTGEVAEIRRQLNNRASEEAATAQFTTHYDEEAGSVVLASDRRADAVVLEAMIADQPDSPLIPKLARGLLDHRVKGAWASTQENAFVLLALDRYFRTYEKETPDFVARAWLGSAFAGESEFRGRSADRSETKVPLAALPADAPQDIVLQKDGAGRLYYRLGLRYAAKDLRLEPLDRGFEVTRAYEAVDDPADVVRTADGTYQVRAGARVRVRLGMVADSRRYHVALVDPLPAGFEALNPELTVTGSQPEAPPTDGEGEAWRPWDWWWFSRWYDHQAFRDERTEAFTSLLYPGVYGFDYVARATTPGRFVAPPARAEEMYHPETFGRSATDEVVVR